MSTYFLVCFDVLILLLLLLLLLLLIYYFHCNILLLILILLINQQSLLCLCTPLQLLSNRVTESDRLLARRKERCC